MRIDRPAHHWIYSAVTTRPEVVMGKFMCVIALASSLNVVVVPVVAAQERAPTPEPATDYAFDDDLVRGDTFGPNAEVLTTRRRGARGSLIRAREHFIDRLLSSVEEL